MRLHRSDMPATCTTRRAAILSASILALSSVRAQLARVPRVALLFPGTSIDPTAASAAARAYIEGLQELGYVDGRNVTIVVRWADGDPRRLAEIAAQLVNDKVDVIVTSGPGVDATRTLTQTIPIVAVVDAPVESGLASTLAKPGGNVTGVTITSDVAMMLGKRLQLLKELVPRAQRVAVIDFKHVDHIRTPGPHRRRMALKPIAGDLGLTVVDVGVSEEADVQPALDAIAEARVDMLMVLNNPVTARHMNRIIAFTTQRRLPSIHDDPDFVRAGALLSFSTADDIERRAAAFVDKILKGAKPGDLPFEQPMRYSLAINLSTAKAIGIDIPRLTLLRADVVVD